VTTLGLTVALAAVIGLSLGLLGGGGSILAVPLLVYVTGLSAKDAIATSLFVVGVTSAVAVLPHALGGRVRWRTGLVFGAAGMTGAYAGGRLAQHIPAGVLLTAFATVMLITATAMIRGRRGPRQPVVPHRLAIGKAIAEGAAVGLGTGLMGAGGGFLVVPALALLGGVPMPAAVGTSLLVIAMQSFAGFAGHLSSADIDWALAGAVTAAAVLGSLAGSRLAGRLREDLMRRAFGWFVVVMGVFVLAQQLPGDVRNNPWLWTGLALATATTAVTAILRQRRHRSKEDETSAGPTGSTPPSADGPPERRPPEPTAAPPASAGRNQVTLMPSTRNLRH
jgi:uncharacterized membrane protein YfcA